MPRFSVPHFEWQVLRAVKRSQQPPTGRELRSVMSRRTKDGTFLTALVWRGLLAYAAGGAAAPFAATYSLTPLGEHAAEYGECELPLELLGPMPPPAPVPKAPARGPVRPRRKGSS